MWYWHKHFKATPPYFLYSSQAYLGGQAFYFHYSIVRLAASLLGLLQVLYEK